MDTSVQVNPAYQSFSNIDIALNRLRDLSLTINFRDVEARKRFLIQFLIIRNRFAEAEEKLTGRSVKRSDSRELNKYLSRPIHQKQMAGWINKLIRNVQLFLQEDHSIEEQLDFIKTQEPLLNIVIKVLNGDAFFVGCELL